MSRTDPIVTTPKRLREIRQALGLSQQAFGALLDRTGRQVGNLERGVTDIDRCIDKAVRYIEEHPSK